MTSIRINNRAITRLRKGHLWVYASDILETNKAQGGEIVEVTNPQGDAVATAFYSSHSQIALRILAKPGEVLDKDFWRKRLLQASVYRKQVVHDTDAYRLVFGESDFLPSLIIDRYGPCLVLQTLSQGMECLKSLWIELLQELFNPAAIVERNDVHVRTLEQLPLQKGILAGQLPSSLDVTLHGLRFRVDVLGSQKTGAFLDQRENYLAAAQYAGGKILDCCCFAGGFALHLARHAENVVAIDTSAEALALASHNAMANSIANIQFVEANIFDFLRESHRQGQRFHQIILDPPAFAKSEDALSGARRGYKEINMRAMRLLLPDGFLVTCSCSYHLREQQFLEILLEAANDIGRQVRIVEKRTQARDHPILLGMPETYYLKCFILQIH